MSAKNGTDATKHMVWLDNNDLNTIGKLGPVEGGGGGGKL